ncbi:MAG TPA: sensor domain-containing diguanylate cyclase [Actinomycetota bacterium]|nr:sensor domain-containing diguanylate cyclase [Actinomycetota bacterium]
MAFGRGGSALGKLVSFLFFAGGAHVILTSLLLPSGTRGLIAYLGGIGIFSGIVFRFLPWDKWSPWTFLFPVMVSFVLLGVANSQFPGPFNPYLPLYTLTFAAVGLTQPPGTALLVAPIGLASYLVPEIGQEFRTALVGAAVAGPVWVLVGEILAGSTTRLIRARRAANSLVDASTSLVRAIDERDVADITSGLALQLLRADRAVFLTTSEESSLLVNRGQTNFPKALGDYELDPTAQKWPPERSLRSNRPTLLPDVTKVDLFPDALRRGLDVTSVLYVPVLGDRGELLGLLITGWSRRKNQLESFYGRVADLLSNEAGRALARVHATRRLARAAESDSLTGLPNRRGFDRVLAEIQVGDALALIDLDHFKMVNDKYGHPAGDETLRQFSKALRSIARHTDTVARYGGEEFALLMAEADQLGALAAMQRLKQLWADSDPLATFSAGVAVHLKDDDVGTTTVRADNALYRAKANGRNRIEFSDPTNEADRQLPVQEAVPVELTDAAS